MEHPPSGRKPQTATIAAQYGAAMIEPSLRDEIRTHYETHIDDEDGRLRSGLGRLELARAQKIVRRHLPPGPLRVLDVGGATGVHAEWLLADRHHVHLIDPVDREAILEAARAVESEPSLLGLSPHLIAMARRRG